MYECLGVSGVMNRKNLKHSYNLKYLLGDFFFDLTNLEDVQCTFKTEQFCNYNNIYWNNTHVLHLHYAVTSDNSFRPSLFPDQCQCQCSVSGDKYHMDVTRTRGLTTEHNNTRTRARKPEMCITK